MNDTELSLLLNAAAHLQTALMHIEQRSDDDILVGHINNALGLLRSVLGDHL